MAGPRGPAMGCCVQVVVLQDLTDCRWCSSQASLRESSGSSCRSRVGCAEAARCGTCHPTHISMSSCRERYPEFLPARMPADSWAGESIETTLPSGLQAVDAGTRGSIISASTRRYSRSPRRGRARDRSRRRPSPCAKRTVSVPGTPLGPSLRDPPVVRADANAHRSRVWSLGGDRFRTMISSRCSPGSRCRSRTHADIWWRASRCSRSSIGSPQGLGSGPYRR
jgi:hypothetical protein